jgi:hypothetical protein
MMKKYQKKIILFPAGASGNFLSAFLTTGSIHVEPQFRIDLGQTVASAVSIPPELEQIKHTIANDHRQTILSHYSAVSNLREYSDRHWVRKIYPHTNVFGWLKNVFYKKQQIEQVDYTQADMLTRFDSLFENIKDFYFIIKSDTDHPDDLTIDFGNLPNLDYLIELYIDSNGFEPNLEKKQFAQSYIDAQHPAINDSDCLDMEDIVKLITPKNLDDLVILLFMYEKNHKTIDQNRLWSIDDLPTDIDRAVDFLVDNSKKYSIFK